MKSRSSQIALFLLLLVNLVHGQTYRLSGTVTDADDGTPLKNATIQIRSIKKSVVSSDSGTFQFLLPIGNYTVLTSFVGYNQKGFTINLLKDESVHIILKKKPSTQLDEVIVNAQIGNNRLNETQMGIIRINPEQLKRIPVAFGEP
ncbi:MAG TPA: carboxypeptidase-like regulatory domain-containing protein, partial [Flavitalea sp.]|nr:carboxypeptidase-like regulatory domain-containing protein [Flavitalea sp.]